MPTGDLGGEPKEISAYLKYAQENIKRSKALFKKGDLRYAVFSANEGLELCVKAHMLRYKIIPKAIVAGHFPYPQAVALMVKITKSSARSGMVTKEMAHQSLKMLQMIKGLFDAIKNIRIIIWKTSLNIELETLRKNMLTNVG